MEFNFVYCSLYSTFSPQFCPWCFHCKADKVSGYTHTINSVLWESIIKGFQSINQSPVSSLEEHRGFTKYFHRTLFVANFFTSLHVFPSLAISSKTVCFHVFLGLPLSLLPWAFQSKVILSTALFSFLIVCPIQFHLRLLISIVISYWFVIFHSSTFKIVSGHLIFKILCKHLLTNVCSYFV